VKAVKKLNKLSYKEQRELDGLPAEIEVMEEEKGAIEARFCEPDYFSSDAEGFQKDQKRLHELESKLGLAYERWEALEAKQESLAG